jgi:hypothetical protein
MTIKFHIPRSIATQFDGKSLCYSNEPCAEYTWVSRLLGTHLKLPHWARGGAAHVVVALLVAYAVRFMAQRQPELFHPSTDATSATIITMMSVLNYHTLHAMMHGRYPEWLFHSLCSMLLVGIPSMLLIPGAIIHNASDGISLGLAGGLVSLAPYVLLRWNPLALIFYTAASLQFHRATLHIITTNEDGAAWLQIYRIFSSILSVAIATWGINAYARNVQAHELHAAIRSMLAHLQTTLSGGPCASPPLRAQLSPRSSPPTLSAIPEDGLTHDQDAAVVTEQSSGAITSTLLDGCRRKHQNPTLYSSTAPVGCRTDDYLAAPGNSDSSLHLDATLNQMD